MDKCSGYPLRDPHSFAVRPETTSRPEIVVSNKSPRVCPVNSVSGWPKFPNGPSTSQHCKTEDKMPPITLWFCMVSLTLILFEFGLHGCYSHIDVGRKHYIYNIFLLFTFRFLYFHTNFYLLSTCPNSRCIFGWVSYFIIGQSPFLPGQCPTFHC